MSRPDQWLFTASICVFAFVGIAVCTASFVAAPYAFADIDYNETQRQVAESKATVLRVFSAIGICVFIVALLISPRISEVILRILDGDKSS